jgi:hypothetical protein
MSDDKIDKGLYRMIDKLARLLDKWLKTTPKDTYTKLLEQFDGPDVGMTDLPTMLVEFWGRIKLGHFVEGPNAREMMYLSIEPRHSTLSELVSIVTLATNALIHEDDATVTEISTDQFMIRKSITLDDYLIGVSGRSISFYEGVRTIKELMVYHNRFIENAPSNYHCRVLNRMYNDILTVTRVISDNMKEDAK